MADPILLTQDNMFDVIEQVNHVLQGGMRRMMGEKSIDIPSIETPYGTGKWIGYGVRSSQETVVSIQVGPGVYEVSNRRGWSLRGDPRFLNQPRSEVANVDPLPPVSQRPKCLCCHKPLRPFHTEYEDINPGQRYTSNERALLVRKVQSYRGHWVWRITTWPGEGRWGVDGQGHFCSNTCGFDFGGLAAKAGYRLKGK